MKKNDYLFNNSIKEQFNKSKEFEEKIIYSNVSQLEKDIYIIINYIRTNPYDFCNNLIRKYNLRMEENKEQIDIINFLEEIYNKERLAPFEIVPEISEAARNLLINIALNDKKYHNINLKEIKPSTLNLRTRLSNYGHRTGRIFETVVFKTNNPEDIINHILVDENGRNMLLSNKMKYIGVACDILPSNIICSVIDIVQDFIPYRNKEILYNNINMNNNYDKIDLESNYYGSQNREEYEPSIDNLPFDNNINNLKLNVREKKIDNISNNRRMNIIISNNNNEQYVSNFAVNNHRKKNTNSHNNLYYKTPKKLNSMDLPSEKDNFISPKSINSYNNIINNKFLPSKKSSNNISQIQKEQNNNKNKNDKNDNNEKNINHSIFTMAGRTCKQQQEVINLNKSKSVCSFDFNKNSKIINKNKLQRLNQKEKLEILHKINQRNKKSFSTNNNNYEDIKGNPFSSKNNIENNLFKKRSYNFEFDFDEKNKNYNFNNINLETENTNFENKFDYNSSNRVNTCASKINDSNIINYYNFNGTSPLNPSFFESKYSQLLDSNDEYSRNKISEIKNDLLLIKNQIKRELKDEVKNELKEEIKYEMTINQNKKKPSSIKIEQEFDIDNIIKRKESKNSNNQSDKNKIQADDEIYFKKNKNNYFLKNRTKNRCSSEEKFIYGKKNNVNFNLRKNNERKTFDPQINLKKNNENYELKSKYKERYEHLNDMQNNNIKSDINFSDIPNYNINNKNSITDLRNKSYFNEGPKVKNRQEIKQLIRLYNIEKDSKRNNNNNDNMYDVISNNKSIPNYFLLKSKNNEDVNINHKINNNNQNKENKNEDKKKEKENYKKNKIHKGFVFHKKYEKVKSLDNFKKQIIKNQNRSFCNLNIDKSLNKEKFIINENNRKENNETYENVNNNNLKNKEEGTAEKDNSNSINEKFSSTGTFNDFNPNNLKTDNKAISIKSYFDKNGIYKNRLKEKKYKPYYSNTDKINKKEICSSKRNKTKEFNYNNENNGKENNIENKNINININTTNNGNPNSITIENITNNIDNNDYNNLKNESKLSSNNFILEDKNIEIKTDKMVYQISKESYEIEGNANKLNKNKITKNKLPKTTPYKEKKYYQYFPIKYKNKDYNGQVINGGNGNI